MTAPRTGQQVHDEHVAMAGQAVQQALDADAEQQRMAQQVVTTGAATDVVPVTPAHAD